MAENPVWTLLKTVPGSQCLVRWALHSHLSHQRTTCFHEEAPTKPRGPIASTTIPRLMWTPAASKTKKPPPLPLDSRFWKATKRLRRPAPPAASHNQPVAVPAQAPYGCVPAAVPAGSVPRPWAQVKSRFSVSRHARTRPQQSPAHQPASSKCGSRHCQGYAFEESAATVRGGITSRNVRVNNDMTSRLPPS